MTAVFTTVAVALLTPTLALWLERRFAIARSISAVVLCYAVGMVVANSGIALDGPAAMQLSGVAVALAIPLLLFGVDLASWLRLARPTVISFGLCLLSVIVWAAIGAQLFDARVERAGDVAGMLVGIYSGGTPNMAAIGKALDVPAQTFLMVNAADILIGSVWLLVLLGFGARLLKRWLRPAGSGAAAGENATPAPLAPGVAWRPRDLAVPLGLAAVCLGVGAGVGELVPAAARDPATLLGLTTVALALATRPWVRALPAAPAAGNWLLLVFCTAIGALADFDLVLHASFDVVAMTTVVMLGAIASHLALGAWLGIDVDTLVITSTAAIYGPAFVPPVADRLGNPAMLLSGVASGLVGYAVGNYLGLGLAWALR